jgi:hypothetical protein
MKRIMMSVLVAAAGSAALAQPLVAPEGRPANVPAPAGVVSPGATNAAPKVDYVKLQALWSEMAAIDKEVRPKAEKLQTSDPDLKALTEKWEAARQTLKDLDTQRRELLEKKISEDPTLAPMVVKRRELQQQLDELRKAAMAAREVRQGMSPQGMPVPGAESSSSPIVRPLPRTLAPASDKPVEVPVPPAK